MSKQNGKTVNDMVNAKRLQKTSPVDVGERWIFYSLL
jgi:hypothetical protein